MTTRKPLDAKRKPLRLKKRYWAVMKNYDSKIAGSEGMGIVRLYESKDIAETSAHYLREFDQIEVEVRKVTITEAK